MSTPSTATITVPPNHQYYSHMAQYLPPINDYPQSPYQPHNPPTSTTTPVRQPNVHNPYSSHYTTLPAPPAVQPQRPSYDNRQRQPVHHEIERDHLASPRADMTSSGHASSSAKRPRPEPVDWDKFFSGGPPKEIIVIHDDTPQPQMIPPPAALEDARHQMSIQASSSNTAPHAGHADKRQRISSSTVYAPVYAYNAMSSANTPQYGLSPSTQAAYSDRTASYNNTTAPTSLGSSSSGGTQGYEPSAGQKRKRSTRQAEAAADSRKLHVQQRHDPFLEYCPPPQPPFKAEEVHVQVIQDTTAHRNQKIDDEDGHYIVTDNTDLTSRYTVVSSLGQGTFGRVVKAYDRHRQRHVAIKIIRAVQKYRDASRIELRVLSTLAHNDRHNRNKCIHLRDTFDFRNHICIVTDLLGQSVFDFLKNNCFVPFPSSHIQQFARQLFTSVAFLHDLNLIHTDLKPENILLTNSQYQTFTYNRNIPSSSSLTARTAKYRRVLLEPEIRLIDFGSATFDDEYHSSVVSTRHYRAPEIYLNLGWSFPCDIWSIGCILVEFFTGDALFQTHEDLEHLAMMEAVCGGPIEKSLVRAVAASRSSNGNKNSATSFFKRQVLDYPRADTPKQSRKFVKAMKQLDEFIPTHTSSFNRQFLDLLRRIFVYDPKKRITAKQVLKHPWFLEHFEDDGTEAERIRIERQRQEAQAHSEGQR